MVDKLTKLIAIFQRPELDFSNNKADGDDIIGDAYEYLMRNLPPKAAKVKDNSIHRQKYHAFLQRS